jgi:hypothetical protein
MKRIDTPMDSNSIPPHINFNGFLCCPVCDSAHAAIHHIVVHPILAPAHSISIDATNGSTSSHPSDPGSGVLLRGACENDHEFTIQLAFSALDMSTSVRATPSQS